MALSLIISKTLLGMNAPKKVHYYKSNVIPGHKPEIKVWTIGQLPWYHLPHGLFMWKR